MVWAEGRLDMMREMILVLEHTQENPIMVDNEENEVAVPIPAPGRLVPIEDAVQVLPNELVGTQIAFELVDEDCPPLCE